MITRERFEDLVNHPREDLGVELKPWLDLRDDKDRANLAHAMLAIANHGGGFVLLGFRETEGGWEPADGGAPDEASYSQDAVNAIVKRYADPAFHCDLHRVRDALGAVRYVVSVPGGHRVPIRAKSGGPDNKHVKEGTYYVRRAGPESAPPQTAAEWDALIQRCVRASKDELADLIRAAVYGTAAAAAPSTSERLAAWSSSSRDRLQALVVDRFAGAPGPYGLGVWTFSYALEHPVDLRLPDVHEAVRRSHASITGWPCFMVMTRPPIAPYPYDGAVECWLYEQGEERDPAHCDFWRASTDGRLFLLRGYQEDGEAQRAGKALDRGLPIWRVAECLLHVQRFAQSVGRADGRAVVRAEWAGLAGRKLGDFLGDWATGADGQPCRQAVAVSEATVEIGTIRAALGDLVQKITAPLYEAFDFATVSRERIEAELKRLLSRA